jgi:zinc transport system substrate-binding protein
MKKKDNLVLSLLSAVIILGTVFQVSVRAEGPLGVFVSIAPQKYFVHQIGKDLVDVQVLVPPGASPATYEPKPKQMTDLSKAKIYFATGVPFEKVWLKKIAATNPELKVVHTDREIRKIPMAAHFHDDGGKSYKKGEHHEDDGRHHEAGHNDIVEQSDQGLLDPHVWLSPPLVKLQGSVILKTLQEVDPSHGTHYKTNYIQFVSKLDELDAQLRKVFAGKQGLEFMVFHPAWGYFAHTYGLKQVPIEVEGKAPKAAHLKDLIEHARERGIKMVFLQPQFSSKRAELVAREIGGHVVIADPLEEDWLTNMRDVADKIMDALR